MEPVREFAERSRRRRLESWPKEGGIEPDKFVEERFISCRDDKEESSEGKEEMLRKVSGIEREMTLPFGEQVMPCHEQGVELDGSHVERTEEDDFAGMRERRTCPSGEREVTS